MENFVEYCKNYISNTLAEYMGQTVEACELGYLITEGPNANGTLTFSTQKALDYLCEWRYDAADYYDHCVDSYGSVLHNPFGNPEAYMVCMVIDGCNSLLQSTKFVQEHYDERIELTQEVIDQIIEDVNDCDEIAFLS